MSVVAEAAAAAAAVGPSSKQQPPVLCGARKRKDVQLEDEAAAAEVEERSEGGGQWRHGLFVLETVEEGDEEESLSIGVESDDSEEEEEDGEETESDERKRKMKGGGLGCFDALDDALPIKRGLSNYFSGKSRSFANLLDVAGTSAKDLAKPENPFNKRRRVLRCSSIRRAASTSLTELPPFVPPNRGAANDATSGGGDSG